MLIAKENRDAVCHTSILLFFGLGKKGLNRSTKVVELLGLDYAVELLQLAACPGLHL